MWIALSLALLVASDGATLTTGSTLSTGEISPKAEAVKPVAGSKVLKSAYEIKAGTASAFLAREIKRLEDVVQKEKKQNIEKVNEQIREIVSGVLDLDYLGRRALIRYWDELGQSEAGKKQRQRYLKLFRELVEENYLDKAKEYVGGDYQIPLLEEATKRGETRILSRVKRDDVDLVLEFFLKQNEANGWRVVDIRLDDTSLEGTYRSNFNRIIRKQGGLETGFPELLRVMDKRLKELRAEGGATRL